MVRRSKKKPRQKKEQKIEPESISTTDIISKIDLSSDNIVRLKITVRKGARIESVPLKKLEKLGKTTNKYWTLEEGWLTLYGF